MGSRTPVCLRNQAV